MYSILPYLLRHCGVVSGENSSSSAQITGSQNSRSWSSFIFSFFRNQENPGHYKTTSYIWKQNEKSADSSDAQKGKTTAKNQPFIDLLFPCLRDNSKNSIKTGNTGNPQDAKTASITPGSSTNIEQVEEDVWNSLSRNLVSNSISENKADSFFLYQFGIALLAFDKEFAQALPSFTLHLNRYFDTQNKFSWEERVESLQKALNAFGNELKNSEYVQNYTILNLNKTLLFDKYAIRALETLPDVIMYFKNLQVLILDNNQISNLPECLAQLPIVELSFNNNWFIGLPEVVLQMKSLKKISFFENPIQALPLNFSALQNLEVICMDQRQSLIDSLPNSFPKLREIRLCREISDSKDHDSSKLELTGLKEKYPNIQIFLQNSNTKITAYDGIRSKL